MPPRRSLSHDHGTRPASRSRRASRFCGDWPPGARAGAVRGRAVCGQSGSSGGARRGGPRSAAAASTPRRTAVPSFAAALGGGARRSAPEMPCIKSLIVVPAPQPVIASGETRKRAIFITPRPGLSIKPRARHFIPAVATACGLSYKRGWAAPRWLRPKPAVAGYRAGEARNASRRLSAASRMRESDA